MYAKPREAGGGGGGGGGGAAGGGTEAPKSLATAARAAASICSSVRASCSCCFFSARLARRWSMRNCLMAAWCRAPPSCSLMLCVARDGGQRGNARKRRRISVDAAGSKQGHGVHYARNKPSSTRTPCCICRVSLTSDARARSGEHGKKAPDATQLAHCWCESPSDAGRGSDRGTYQAYVINKSCIIACSPACRPAPTPCSARSSASAGTPSSQPSSSVHRCHAPITAYNAT